MIAYAHIMHTCIHVHVYLGQRNEPETTIQSEIVTTTRKMDETTTFHAHKSSSVPNNSTEIIRELCMVIQYWVSFNIILFRPIGSLGAGGCTSPLRLEFINNSIQNG